MIPRSKTILFIFALGFFSLVAILFWGCGGGSQIQSNQNPAPTPVVFPADISGSYQFKFDVLTADLQLKQTGWTAQNENSLTVTGTVTRPPNLMSCLVPIELPHLAANGKVSFTPPSTKESLEISLYFTDTSDAMRAVTLSTNDFSALAGTWQAGPRSDQWPFCLGATGTWTATRAP